MTIHGEGLEPTAHRVAKHIKTSLKVGGKAVGGRDAVAVRSIRIEPCRRKRMVVVKGQFEPVDIEEEEEDEWPSGVLRNSEGQLDD